uniref:Fibronectin type-III domain-containing protein n=1 Tax=Periophthalmus magnuspinnatus TaxID=409849 RepID=A0A3B4ADC5_9GOBI
LFLPNLSSSLISLSFYKRGVFVSADVPSEPLNCRVNKTNKDCMFVAWERPESDGGSPITGYYIERKERNSLLWVKANDTVVRTTEYPCAGLIEGLEYTFRVSAINRAGQGKPSVKTDFVTARTPNPSVTDSTNSTLSVSWGAPANNGGSAILGYLVECKRCDTNDWIRCNVPRNLQETSYVIQNLLHKSEYQVRV